MIQCSAATAMGTRCVFAVKAPSKSLCGKHLNAVARGTVVTNADTGRKFPALRK
jgi:hypothetical protein